MNTKVTSDGFVWKLLTNEEAKRVFGIIPVYFLYEDETESLIEHPIEIGANDLQIGIEVGFVDGLSLHPSEWTIMKYFDEKYGKNILLRLEKLKEEVCELKIASNIFCKLSEFAPEQEPTEAEKEAFRDEVSDVLTVITHVGHCCGLTSLELMQMAYNKCKRREVDPMYKRSK